MQDRQSPSTLSRAVRVLFPLLALILVHGSVFAQSFTKVFQCPPGTSMIGMTDRPTRAESPHVVFLNLLGGDGADIVRYAAETRSVDTISVNSCELYLDVERQQLDTMCAGHALLACSPVDTSIVASRDGSPSQYDCSFAFDIYTGSSGGVTKCPIGWSLNSWRLGRHAFDPMDSTAILTDWHWDSWNTQPGLVRVRFNPCPISYRLDSAITMLRTGYVALLYVDVSTPGTIFINDTVLLRSTDNGATWKRVGIPAVNALCHDSTRNVWIAAGGKGVGIFRSTDGGVSFTPVSSASGSAAAYDARTGAFYVADTGRIMRSTDGGATFSVYNNVFSKFEIVGLAVSPTGVLCGTRDGLYEITSEEVWVADAAGSPTAPTLAIAPNPAHDAVRVMLDGMSRDARVTITDMLGRIVRDCTPQLRNAPHVSIDLESLPSGSYLVRVADGGRSVARVLLVSKN